MVSTTAWYDKSDRDPYSKTGGKGYITLKKQQSSIGNSHSKERKNNEPGGQQQQQQWSSNSTDGSGHCSKLSIGERKHQLTGGDRSSNSSNEGENSTVHGDWYCNSEIKMISN